MKKVVTILFIIGFSTNVFSDVGNYEVQDILSRWTEKIESNREKLTDLALEAQDNGKTNHYLELSKTVDDLDDISELISEKSL